MTIWGRYQRGFGEESASPLLKEYLDNRRKPDPEKCEKDEDGYEIPSYDIDRTWSERKKNYE